VSRRDQVSSGVDGHADLIHEAVDGLTGEDPPDGWRPKSGRYRLPGAAA